MNKIFLSLIFLFLGMNISFAQKAKVKSAYNYYKEPYQQYDKAKEAIDEAVLHEQTKNSEEAWYYRGLIYAALYKNPSYGALCNNCLQTAYESYKKSLELNPKGDYALEINAIRLSFLANQVFKEGVENFNSGKFDMALASFELVHQIVPGDTAAILNSAFSAERAGKTEKAKMYFEKLMSMGVTDPGYYISLSDLYRNTNENSKALEVIRNGRKIHPDTLSLMYHEINLLLSMNRSQEASEVINTALKKDPANESLYLVLGNNYEKLANPKDEAGMDLPKPANSSELMSQAMDVYKKGLAVNPNNYGLNFNIGAYYFNLAAEQVNAANKITSIPESDKVKAQAVQNFKNAQPYLEKALETNPKLNEDDNSIYDSTLNSLKELYARTNQTEKYEKINALMNK